MRLHTLFTVDVDPTMYAEQNFTDCGLPDGALLLPPLFCGQSRLKWPTFLHLKHRTRLRTSSSGLALPPNCRLSFVEVMALRASFHVCGDFAHVARTVMASLSSMISSSGGSSL